MIMILSLCASEFKQMKTQRRKNAKRSQGSFLIKQRARSAPSFDWVSGLVGSGQMMMGEKGAEVLVVGLKC